MGHLPAPPGIVRELGAPRVLGRGNSGRPEFGAGAGVVIMVHGAPWDVFQGSAHYQAAKGADALAYLEKNLAPPGPPEVLRATNILRTFPLQESAHSTCSEHGKQVLTLRAVITGNKCTLYVQ